MIMLLAKRNIVVEIKKTFCKQDFIQNYYATDKIKEYILENKAEKLACIPVKKRKEQILYLS